MGHTEYEQHSERWNRLSQPHGYPVQIMVEKTPVQAGTLFGSVKTPEGEELARFAVFSDGLFFEESGFQNKATVHFDRCKMNHTTGEMEFSCDVPQYDLWLAYRYEEEYADDTYYIRGEIGGCMGHLLVCPKCGRKIVVEIALIGTNHNLAVAAVCADCMEVGEPLRKENPALAEKIQLMVERFRQEGQ